MGLGDFFDKTVDQLTAAAKTVATPVTLPLGATLDFARFATGDNDLGPDWLSTTDSVSGITETFLGEGTLTGWSITQVGQLANDAYRNGIENPVEAAYYMFPNGLAGGPARSWSDAWDVAQDRNFGQTSQLIANESVNELSDKTGGWDTSKAVRGVPLVGPALEQAGIGAPETARIKASDPDAWDEFHKVSPFFSGALASVVDIGAQFATDPFLIAGKATQAPRALRKARPILDGEEIGLAERMATEKTHKVLGLPSKKAGLQSRTDPLIGTVKYEDHIVDGKAVVDADGVPVKVASPGEAGWLDGKSAAQVYSGLELRTHSYGDEIATLLSRTNDIKNPAEKVNIRRDILASMGGDAAANARLARASESKEFAYTLSNAFRGRGTGEIEASLADEAAAVAGKARVTHAEPEVVVGITGELKAQNGFDEWLYASMKDRTLTVSPKANRALARLAGQGLGRDGSLRTGHTGFDDIVNDKVLGKFEPNGSVVDRGIAASDELAEGVPLRDSKLYQADQMEWSRGANSQPATLLRGGIKLAAWGSGAAPSAKLAAKASDALRGRVVQGALNIEDAPLTIAVTQDFLRRTGVAADDIDSLTSSVINASGPTARSIAVTKAQDHAIGVLADRYGVDRGLIEKIQSEHALRQDATMSALRGQSYSAHMRVDEATGDLRSGDLVYLPDEGGTAVLPILDTQTINNMPLMDLDYVEKWLKRDKVAGVIGKALSNFGTNPQMKRAIELGFNQRVTGALDSNTLKWSRFLAEESNAWWKRGVLLTRAPSYAMRNSAEEMMRVAAISQSAAVADTAARQAAHRALDHARRKGDARYQHLAPEYATLELRQTELDDLRSLHDDPDIIENVKAIRDELRALRAKQTRLANAGKITESDEVRSSIEWIQSMPQLTEHAQWADEIAVLDRDIAGLGKSLEEKVIPDSGFRTIDGFDDLRFPEAYEGVSGRMAYERVAGSGTFDQDVTEYAERSFSRRRGVGESNTIMPPRPGDEKDVVDRHMTAWSWIINRQVRQDAAAQVALRGMAEQAEDIAPRVQAFLDSPAGSKYRKNNPHRADDTEAWADEISEMVKHHVPDSHTAERLVDGEVSKAELAELWPDEFARPEVHVAGVDGLMGFSNRKFARLAGRAFRGIDKVSVNVLTRHPLYVATFQAEQERLAVDFLRKARTELGDDATVSLDDINNLTERARKSAHSKVRETFYDTSSKSSAAQKLRFIYPFFAAHQNSMGFWGKAVANNPNVLRQLQLAFQVPASLGLVVDREGNEVTPGEFIQSDHMVLLQVPKAWGGPDPQDPTAMQTGYRLPLSSANLITQNGSILNPGAGPMAAIPAAYIQKKWGAKDDELAQVLTWFNPFGAPKQGDSPFLPGPLQGLDPALPTPIKRLGTLWDAHTETNSREYMEMWSLRFQEEQVNFYEENERPPTKAEAVKIEAEVTHSVKQMAWLRFATSTMSPIQPQPYSRRSGFITEFRNLQEQGRNEGRGPFWATDTFLGKYGNAYMALTKSTSENRANLDPSSASVRTLEANKKLTDITTPETWRVIVGGEGEGAFSMDAYRWMQDKSINKVYGGGTMIDRKDPANLLFDVNVAAGWREFTKYKNLLMSAATDAGYPSIEKSPQLKAMKKQLVEELSQKFPDWYSEYSSPGDNDYDTTYLQSLRTITADKKLANDPAREDIRSLQTYIQSRDAVQKVLDYRAAGGGFATLNAQANADVAILFASLVDQLAEENTAFSDYALDGIISRDPMYKAGLKAMETSL